MTILIKLDIPLIKKQYFISALPEDSLQSIISEIHDIDFPSETLFKSESNTIVSTTLPFQQYGNENLPHGSKNGQKLISIKVIFPDRINLQNVNKQTEKRSQVKMKKGIIQNPSLSFEKDTYSYPKIVPIPKLV